MTDDLQAAVRAKLDRAEIEREPFPHLVVPDLLPQPFFGELSDSIPPLEAFEPSQRGIKADLPVSDGNEFFEAAPERFRNAWRTLRGEVMKPVVGPALAQRLEGEIREKFADLFSLDLADRIMADGLVASNGRIMSRKAGYWLKPHTDSAHFAVTCLLYFTSGESAPAGALCLFRPERTPELRDVSTYYPDRAEGIEAEVVKEIPIRENLFVAFLNGRESLHGVRIEPGQIDAPSRLTYQAHILPRTDVRKEAEEFAGELPDPQARQRWERYVEDRRARREAGTRQG